MKDFSIKKINQTFQYKFNYMNFYKKALKINKEKIVIKLHLKMMKKFNYQIEKIEIQFLFKIFIEFNIIMIYKLI